MPTYEYACKSCGQHLEVYQAFSDDPLTTCPSCEGPLRKVFGNIAIAFKGSGFYSTDNRSVAKNGAAGTGVEGSWGAEKSSGDGKEPASSGSGSGSAGSGSASSESSGSDSGTSSSSSSSSTPDSSSSGSSGSSGSGSSGAKSGEKSKAAAS